MMISRLFLVTSLIVLSIPNWAQSDFLRPAQSIFELHDVQYDYYSKIRQVLLNDLSEKPQIRYMVLDSFLPESVVEIHFDTDSDKYYAVFRRCSEMIWLNEDWQDISVDCYKKEITFESMELITALFGTALLNVKQIPDFNGGMDGVNYYFSSFHDDMITGFVWTPSKGSRMDKLVEIADDLIIKTKSKSKIIDFSEIEQERIKLLIDDFDK